MSTHSIEAKNFVKFNDEYVLDIQDQSTTTQFKQCSNANSTTSAFTEINCRSKPTKTQRSLLTLTPQISQRRGSQSLADQTMRNEDDVDIFQILVMCLKPLWKEISIYHILVFLNKYLKQIYLIHYLDLYTHDKFNVFKIFYDSLTLQNVSHKIKSVLHRQYDVNIDHKYEILIKTTKVQITIGDLIQLAISQFNEQNEYLQTPFSSDVNNQYLYELYIPKKKKGTPNEDFPCFADSTLLSQSNQTEFALKVTLKQSKYQTSLSNTKHSSTIKQNEKQVLGSKNSSSKKKNLFQSLFFCCNQAEDY